MDSFLKETFFHTYTTLLFKRKSDECDKDANSQLCEKPSTITGAELGVAICIPVVVVASILGGLSLRAYKMNKKEQQEFERDPDFYKNDEEFIAVNDMPVYPPPAYSHNMINNDSADSLGGKGSLSPRLAPGESPYVSTVSLHNPFDSKEDRYSVTNSSVNLTKGH